MKLDIDDFKSKLTTKTKLVSLLHISNTLGCCNPIKEISQLAKQNNALVLLDACQSLAHKKVDVVDLGIDFLAGSGTNYVALQVLDSFGQRKKF